MSFADDTKVGTRVALEDWLESVNCSSLLLNEKKNAIQKEKFNVGDTALVRTPKNK